MSTKSSSESSHPPVPTQSSQQDSQQANKRVDNVNQVAQELFGSDAWANIQSHLTEHSALNKEQSSFVIRAAEKGLTNVVQFLLGADRTLSQEVLDMAVYSAAGSGHFDVIDFLLSEGRSLGQEALDESVKNAADSGHLEAIQVLLNKGTIPSQEAVDESIAGAAEAGCLNIIKFLLSKGVSLSQNGFEKALNAASKSGSCDILEFLLSEDRPLSQEALDCAVKSAGKAGHFDAIGFLLKESRALNLEDIEELCTAANNGLSDQVQSLLSDKSRLLPEIGLREAITMASEKDHLHIVQFLLSEGRTISQEGLDVVVAEIAESGHLHILEFLLSEGRALSQNGLDACVRLSVAKNQLQLLTFFLNEARVAPQDALEWSVLEASEKGYVEILEFLIGRGSIHEDILRSAIMNATGSNRQACLNVLQNATLIQNSDEVERPNLADNEMYLNLNEVRRNPFDYLKTIAEEFPTRVYILNDDGSMSQAIDLGGITKQFITSLCEALVAKGLVGVTDEGLPKADTDQQQEVCRLLAGLISHIQVANIHKTDKILTGPLFAASFLQMVKELATGANEEASFKKICEIVQQHNPSLQIAAKLILEPTLIHKNAYLNQMGEELSDSILPEDETIQTAREHIEPFYQAAKSFLEGTTDEFKDQLIQSIDLQALLSSFQGEPISAKGILSSLRLSPSELQFSLKTQEMMNVLTSNDQEAIEALQNRLRQEQQERDTIQEAPKEAFLDKVQWLVETLALKDATQEEDREWLTLFVFAITGKKGMAPGMTLNLQEGHREGLTFELHTCINRLDLPKVAVSRADFIAALEIAINKDDYNMA